MVNYNGVYAHSHQAVNVLYTPIHVQESREDCLYPFMLNSEWKIALDESMRFNKVFPEQWRTLSLSTPNHNLAAGKLEQL